jgi:hypothetical protein
MKMKRRNNLVCAVAICSNPKDDSILYHRFPKNKELRKKWIVACKREDQFNPSTSTVCSNHFLPTDYERDLRNELLGLPVKKRLRKDAFPTVYINPNSSTKLSSVKIQEERRTRIEKREQKNFIEGLVQEVTKTSLDVASHEGSPIRENFQLDQSTQTDVKEKTTIGIQVNILKSKLYFEQLVIFVISYLKGVLKV